MVAQFPAGGGAQVSEDSLIWAFRAISDAVHVAVSRSYAAPADDRLAMLRETLIEAHRRYEEKAAAWPSATEERLQDAAGSVEAIKTLGGAGLSISRVILHAFGVA
jgi:hypothetical protein